MTCLLCVGSPCASSENDQTPISITTADCLIHPEIRPRISPSAADRRPSAPPAEPSTGGDTTRRVLMVSDNGAGMGHLSRLMAIARRLPADHTAVIATQSYAASDAHDEGFLTEYIPSRKVLQAAQPRWTALLRDRLAHLIELHEPAVVAVDCLPHPGIVEAVRDHPGLIWVWVRRAMWRRGVGADWIAEGKVFDHVLEPGEFAAVVDEGPTVADRPRAVQVEPITFLDEDELLTPAAARAELDLDDRPAALLQLGAGNINDISSPTARICRHLAERGFQLVLAESTIATTPLPRIAGAKVVRLYPVSRYLRAFDLTVSAAGYNSFHEQIGFGIPTVFLPNAATQWAHYDATYGAAGEGVRCNSTPTGVNCISDQLVGTTWVELYMFGVTAEAPSRALAASIATAVSAAAPGAAAWTPPSGTTTFGDCTQLLTPSQVATDLGVTGGGIVFTQPAGGYSIQAAAQQIAHAEGCLLQYADEDNTAGQITWLRGGAWAFDAALAAADPGSGAITPAPIAGLAAGDRAQIRCLDPSLNEDGAGECTVDLELGGNWIQVIYSPNPGDLATADLRTGALAVAAHLVSGYNAHAH